VHPPREVPGGGDADVDAEPLGVEGAISALAIRLIGQMLSSRAPRVNHVSQKLCMAGVNRRKFASTLFRCAPLEISRTRLARIRRAARKDPETWRVGGGGPCRASHFPFPVPETRARVGNIIETALFAPLTHVYRRKVRNTGAEPRQRLISAPHSVPGLRLHSGYTGYNRGRVNAIL
jgi:hypothetical protein